MASCCESFCTCLGALPIWPAIAIAVSIAATSMTIVSLDALCEPILKYVAAHPAALEGHGTAMDSIQIGTEFLLFLNLVIFERIFAFKLSVRYPSCTAPLYGLKVDEIPVIGGCLSCLFKLYPMIVLALAWSATFGSILLVVSNVTLSTVLAVVAGLVKVGGGNVKQIMDLMGTLADAGMPVAIEAEQKAMVESVIEDMTKHSDTIFHSAGKLVGASVVLQFAQIMLLTSYLVTYGASDAAKSATAKAPTEDTKLLPDKEDKSEPQP
jgi:hypothetical protein